MIAAIYARKSTEQSVADEHKSVARQIEHARQYAERKGWTIEEASVYVDHGISGAEFARRLEREKARHRTFDAMLRKARAGHVTGGRVFGYDNIDVMAADGSRSHVERRVNEAEAEIIRAIFQCGRPRADVDRKEAQRQGAPCPRSQQCRPSSRASQTGVR